MPTAATIRAPHVRQRTEGRARHVLRAIGEALVAGSWGAGWSLPYGAAQAIHERYERERLAR